MPVALDGFQLRGIRSTRMRSVGEQVKRRLADLGMSKPVFQTRVGTDAGTMSKILRGLRQVPRDKLDRWCEVLGMTGRAEEEFRTAVELTWATPFLRAFVERLVEDDTNLRGLLAHYEDSVELIAKHVEPLRKLRGRRIPPAG